MKIDVYSRKNTWKFLLFLCATAIGILTLLYTETFLKKLRVEEEKRLLLWAESVNTINRSPSDAELNLASLLIESNTTIPLIMTDAEGGIISHRNLDPNRVEDSVYLRKQLDVMRAEHDPIEVPFDEGQVNLIFYRNSNLLTQLRLYPMVLLAVIAMLVGVAYLAFSSSRRAEQDRVWTGLARETAHQIGTPLSSLIGWVHLLREQKVDEMITDEMERDVHRLERITDRFSKIGSVPELQEQDVRDLVERSVDYLRVRVAKRIALHFEHPREGEWLVRVNAPLFEWVLENLIRNAVDALEGKGEVFVQMQSGNQYVRIQVRDTGKGMSAAQVRRAFRPGYTTKKRGWGLGLTLAYRIIEQYHNGSISVAQSEPGKGTTMQVKLPKA
mgnify:CR=1 FL=1